MFRLVLDLSCFFHNHKRKARIFVKESIKTVGDLQCRISEVFGVKNFELYASEGHCYLPPLEDVRVLRDDEVVSVIPNDKSKHQIELSCEPPPVTVIEKLKKSKRVLESVAEEHSEELSSPKKKKHKEREVTDTSEDETPKSKKKSKHSKEEDETPKNKKKSKHSKEIKSNNSFETILDKKSKSTEKAKSFDTLLPALKSHIKSCDKTGRTASHSMHSSTSVQLSSRIDTPYKKFKKFELIPLITNEVLNKKKVNIVKIDIIKQGGEVQINEKNNKVPEHGSADITSFSTPKVSFVKNVVNYIEHENTLSPEDMLTSNPTGNLNCSLSLEKSADSSCLSQEDKITKMDVETPVQENFYMQTRTSLWSNSLNDSDHKCLDTNFIEANTSQTEVTNENSKKSASFSIPDHSKTSARDSIHSDLSTTEEKVQNKLESSTKNNLQSSDFLKPKLSESNNKSSFFNVNVSKQNDSFNFSLNKSSDTELITFNSTNESIQNISSEPPNSEKKTNESIQNISSEPPNSEKKNFFYMKRKFAGVAAYLDQLKEGDVDQGSSSKGECSSNNNFVTKRQRKRVRHRRTNKSRDHSNASTSDASFVKEEYVPKPMNVSACPKIHVKFDDKSDGEISSENPLDLAKPKDQLQMQQTEEKKPDKNIVAEAVFSEDTILKSPIMLQLDPKEGDVIAFKMLIMKNFTPVISQYLVGRVLDFSNDKVVKMEMLSGNLKDLNEEEEENLKIKNYPWQKLIAPRLIFP